MSKEKSSGMKSAYELAMERFGDDDAPSISDKQKEDIAEIDQKTQAKVAEIEIMHQQKIDAAMTEGDFGKVTTLEQELVEQKQKARDQGEAKKEDIRNA